MAKLTSFTAMRSPYFDQVVGLQDSAGHGVGSAWSSRFALTGSSYHCDRRESRATFHPPRMMNVTGTAFVASVWGFRIPLVRTYNQSVCPTAHRGAKRKRAAHLRIVRRLICRRTLSMLEGDRFA